MFLTGLQDGRAFLELGPAKDSSALPVLCPVPIIQRDSELDVRQ